jgi:CBS domain-containing protein
MNLSPPISTLPRFPGVNPGLQVTSVAFGRDPRDIDGTTDRLKASFEDEATRARHNIVSVLKVRRKLSFSDRVRTVFNRMLGVREEPKLVGNLRESDIRVSYPTDFNKFQTDGYLTRGVVVTVDSDETLHQVVVVLNNSLGMFTPVEPEKRPGKYYKYFDTPVEFIIHPRRED